MFNNRYSSFLSLSFNENICSRILESREGGRTRFLQWQFLLHVQLRLTAAAVPLTSSLSERERERQKWVRDVVLMMSSSAFAPPLLKLSSSTQNFPSPASRPSLRPPCSPPTRVTSFRSFLFVYLKLNLPGAELSPQPTFSSLGDFFASSSSRVSDGQKSGLRSKKKLSRRLFVPLPSPFPSPHFREEEEEKGCKEFARVRRQEEERICSGH